MKKLLLSRVFCNLILPFLLCAYGLYFTFHHFWNGFDSISGDLGDARFNTLVLEHTWLWLRGIHASLFDMPIFYPHQNAYAFSDYLLSLAPLYWIFRASGLEMLLSFQWWLVSLCAINFIAFLFFARKYLNFHPALAALGAYVFSFALPRITHLEHAQLIPQFYILISAMGAMNWWKNPRSKKGISLFVAGAVLQLTCAFYFFWFWIWSLAMILIYLMTNTDRRLFLKAWARQIDFKFLSIISGLAFALAIPFLYHYLLVGKEMGMRGWVVISDSVPRIYSWFNIPQDHWQWAWIPFKESIQSLPVVHEHLMSFGMLTWISMIMALIWNHRQRHFRYRTLPLIAMFLFTLSIGRFSSWAFITYLFPGGAVVRAVARIQIFMLLFWAIVYIEYLKELFESKAIHYRILAGLIIFSFFAENTYRSDWVFSRASETARIQTLGEKLPPECKIIAYPEGFRLYADFPNLDAMMLSFSTGRLTLNGYSGNQPKAFSEVFFPTEKSFQEKVSEWFLVHHLPVPEKVCELKRPDLGL